jgi:hypothetical protein
VAVAITCSGRLIKFIASSTITHLPASIAHSACPAVSHTAMSASGTPAKRNAFWAASRFVSATTRSVRRGMNRAWVTMAVPKLPPPINPAQTTAGSLT